MTMIITLDGYIMGCIAYPSVILQRSDEPDLRLRNNVLWLRQRLWLRQGYINSEFAEVSLTFHRQRMKLWANVFFTQDLIAKLRILINYAPALWLLTIINIHLNQTRLHKLLCIRPILVPIQRAHTRRILH